MVVPPSGTAPTAVVVEVDIRKAKLVPAPWSDQDAGVSSNPSAWAIPLPVKDIEPASVSLVSLFHTLHYDKVFTDSSSCAASLFRVGRVGIRINDPLIKRLNL
jgi:hypothetical protein